MNDTWLKALILVCTFGAVLLLVEVLVSTLASNRVAGRAINLRLKLIAQGRSHDERMGVLRRRISALPTGLPPALQRLGERFERTLIMAQVAIPTGRLMLILLLAPIAIFLLLLLVLIVSDFAMSAGQLLMIATFSFVLGLALPLLALQYKATRMRKKMQDQFPVALDVFVRGLRAGHPIAAALDLLTVEMSDPIGSEFGVVVDEVTYGADLRDALQSMADRWDLDDMRMFVVSLAVQNETGGNLAEILDNLSKVIRERHSMMMKVRALSSEGRMTAVMLTILPVLSFAALFMMNPRFYLDVADDPAFLPGFVGLIIMYLIGFFTIRKMVDLKV